MVDDPGECKSELAEPRSAWEHNRRCYEQRMSILRDELRFASKEQRAVFAGWGITD